VLPCANEGRFVEATVKAVSDSVPGGGGGSILAEIVVVDDGSRPAVSKSLSKELLERLGVKIVRHERPQGLIRAKSAGAKVTTGDVLVFFDCHVVPQPGWHTAFLEAMRASYRRIVVPSITDLDIDTWTQTRKTNAVSSCYLTWDADFKWYRSAGEHIPILSGGLLGISRRWWTETGGYDDRMETWGGENIDQSLRTWLCGGEIVAVPSAQVAHMWRRPTDPRTTAGYTASAVDTLRNRARVAMGWFGNFSAKLADYPDMEFVGWRGMDTASFDRVRDGLQCRPFAWYLWRFREIYERAGLVPKETFRLRHVKSGKCLTYMGPQGTHPQGREVLSLGSCGERTVTQWPSQPTDAQRWHHANQVAGAGTCCSGFRVWNTDQCLTHYPNVGTVICEVLGRFDQALRLTGDADEGLAPGQLASVRRTCLVKRQGKLEMDACKESAAGQKTRPAWEKIAILEPLEHVLYRKAKEESPELFA